MLGTGHPGKDKIKPRIINLNEGWEQLLINCKEKKSRLQEAYQVQNKNSDVDWFTQWQSVFQLSMSGIRRRFIQQTEREENICEWKDKCT